MKPRLVQLDENAGFSMSWNMEIVTTKGEKASNETMWLLTAKPQNILPRNSID